MKRGFAAILLLGLALVAWWLAGVRSGHESVRDARGAATSSPRTDVVERTRCVEDAALEVVDPDAARDVAQRVDAPSAGGRELLAGKVTWSSGGYAGFANLEVRAERDPSFVRGLTADGFGNFRLEVPDRGPYRLVASREKSVMGLSVALERVECRALAEHVLAPRTDLRLALSAPFEIRGKVVGPDGVSLRAFHVRARSSAGVDEWGQVVEAEFFSNDGAFALVVPNAGAWDVSATAACFEPSMARSLDVAGILEGVELALGPTATVRGIVLDPDGAPVAGARVVGGAQSDELDYATLNRDKSGYEGEFSLACLRPGTQTIVAESEGWAPSEPLQLELSSGMVHEGAVLRLRRGATLEVRLRFAHPSAVRRVKAEIVPAGRVRGLSWPEWRTADEPRSFLCSFSKLRPGECTFVAEVEDELGRRRLTRIVELADASTFALECNDETLPRVRVGGRVTCGDEPVQGALVEFRDEHGRFARAHTNSVGEYEIALAEHGAWSVSCDGEDGRVDADIVVPDVSQWAYDVELGGARVAGRLVGAEGVAVRLEIELESESVAAVFTASTVSETDRSFEFPSVPPGSYSLVTHDRIRGDVARATWIGEPLEHVVVKPGESVTGLELRLVPAARLTVVLDGMGAAGTVGVVNVFGRTQWLDTARAYATRGRAACSFDALAPGEVRVLATCGERFGLSGWMTVGAVQRELVLDLAPAARVAFEFVSRDRSDSVEDYDVVVPATDELAPISWSDDPWDDIEARKLEAVLPPGAYELVTRLAGGRSVRTRFEAKVGRTTCVPVRLD